MRDEGVIKAWGLGVNRVEPIELLLALEGPRPDAFLLAGRYTLLDHARALQRVMPMVAEHELGIVVGGPYSSGALVGGPNFEYAPASPEILAKVARIKAIADRYGVSMKGAGLQFALANPAVAAVIPARAVRAASPRIARRWGDCSCRFLARTSLGGARQSVRAASHYRLSSASSAPKCSPAKPCFVRSATASTSGASQPGRKT